MSLATYAQRSSRLTACRLPLYDFLAPSNVHSAQPILSIRLASTSASTPIHDSNTESESVSNSKPIRSAPEAAANPAPLHKPLTQAQQDFLTSALRVNQAGELAATRIYRGQTPTLIASHPHLRPLMKHMHDQEAGHFQTFNALLAKHRIRPTAMYPVWSVVSTALGWGTAMLGREAAMACTEAVETEIGDHYNNQVRTLLEMVGEMEARGEVIGSELSELVSTIRRIRDEELEHLDHAVENDSKEAVPHAFLTGVIRAGCRGAIWVSERV